MMQDLKIKHQVNKFSPSVWVNKNGITSSVGMRMSPWSPHFWIIFNIYRAFQSKNRSSFSIRQRRPRTGPFYFWNQPEIVNQRVNRNRPADPRQNNMFIIPPRDRRRNGLECAGNFIIKKNRACSIRVKFFGERKFVDLPGSNGWKIGKREEKNLACERCDDNLW